MSMAEIPIPEDEACNVEECRLDNLEPSLATSLDAGFLPTTIE